MFCKARDTAIQKSLRIDSLLFLIERFQFRWFGRVSRMLQERFTSKFNML